MLKLATLIWMILGTALAGAFMIPILAVPSLADYGMALIPYAAGSGFLLAVPLAILVAWKIYAATAARRTA
jgi:hypothetical protein